MPKYIILHQHSKNYDYMMLGWKDLAWDKQTGYFRPIYTLYPCRGSKYLGQFLAFYGPGA